MEGLILLGILGAGYMINEDKEKKQKVYNEIQPPLFTGSGNTIYDMNNVKDAQRYEIDQVMKHHTKAMDPGSKVIDALNMDGRNTLRSSGSTNEIKTMDGNTMDKKNFLVNDQGIKLEPFFGGEGPAPVDLGSRSRALEGSNGGFMSERPSRAHQPEAPNFGDQWVQNLANVFGNTFDGPNSDQSRYIEGNYRTNELPFEQERVSHIDVKSDINRDVDLLYAQRNSTDNRRTLNNQKLSFGGKVLAGKGISEKRGEEGQVFKHLPDQDYVNSADKWLVTTGAIEAPRIRPETELKETNRQYLNEGDFGPAAPAIFKSNEDRPNYKKTTKQQLLNDTERNVALEGKMNDNDHNKSSYFVYPNEREVTTERTYEGNFKSVFNAETSQLQDSVKPTIKETTLDSSNGFTGPTVTKLPEERLQDNVRPTVKSTTMFEYSGNGGTTVPAEMASDQYLRAIPNLNPNKEVLSRGRDPTPENTKLTNGMDTLNVDIKKIESDYFNPRINNVDKVYQEIPQDYTCQFTQDKETLDNVKLSDRLDPNLLDPFRENPYTKSLASFA
jgi:hypothetical protein